jgi:hypothetical protein
MNKKILIIFGLIWNLQIFAVNDYEKLEKGHVHEAFMNNESTFPLLSIIPLQPPSPLEEQLSYQTDPQAIWIEGYWDWSFELSDFVWCSGCWRNPPPGYEWISGYWVKMNEGWVRIRGFWSDIPESQLIFINQTPPDPYNENPQNPPTNDYFWMSGYWQYEQGNYVWYEGKWEKLDKKWIYAPPKYMWRPDGYVFVPAFWDFPLDQRGIAYACLVIQPHIRQIEYLSEWIVEPSYLIDQCVLNYPDYTYFYYYYTHYHPEWWQNCPWCPPWWGWDWWWMPWSDQWGIWWWWCNPGFPAPQWLDASLVNQIAPPPPPLLQAVHSVHPPAIIGPKGLIPPAKLIHASGGKPLLPRSPRRIQRKASRGLKEGSTERPRGERKPIDKAKKNYPKMPQTTPKAPADSPAAKPSSPPRASQTKDPSKVQAPAKPEQKDLKGIPQAPQRNTRPRTPQQTQPPQKGPNIQQRQPQQTQPQQKGPNIQQRQPQQTQPQQKGPNIQQRQPQQTQPQQKGPNIQQRQPQQTQPQQKGPNIQQRQPQQIQPSQKGPNIQQRQPQQTQPSQKGPNKKPNQQQSNQS